MLAYRDAKQRGNDGLFVFYNSGPYSGASQPHRHLQLLPVARMRDGLDTVEGGDRWGVLADAAAATAEGAEGVSILEGLPFLALKSRLGDHVDSNRLREVYLALYRRACVVAGVPREEAEKTEGEAAISYNLAMTAEAMVLCPRLAEGGAVMNKDGKEAGRVELNGTVLAGTALVKSEAEWAALRKDPGQLGRVLAGIGVVTGGTGAG